MHRKRRGNLIALSDILFDLATCETCFTFISTRCIFSISRNNARPCDALPHVYILDGNCAVCNAAAFRLTWKYECISTEQFLLLTAMQIASEMMAKTKSWHLPIKNEKQKEKFDFLIPNRSETRSRSFGWFEILLFSFCCLRRMHFGLMCNFFKWPLPDLCFLSLRFHFIDGEERKRSHQILLIVLVFAPNFPVFDSGVQLQTDITICAGIAVCGCDGDGGFNSQLLWLLFFRFELTFSEKEIGMLLPNKSISLLNPFANVRWLRFHRV